MTLRNRMERAGFRRDDWGDWFQIVAGCGALVSADPRGIAVAPSDGWVGASPLFPMRPHGLPDLAQRAKAAARKLARRIGFERREARKGMR